MIAVDLLSPSETRKLAKGLAAELNAPALVTVSGDLGSGKSVFVRAVLRKKGVRGAITSPSFALAQSYRGRGGVRLHHLDLYRLSEGDDVDLFAWDDYLEENALTLIEWPAVGLDQLPPPTVVVELEHRGPRRRLARVWADEGLEGVLARRLREAGLQYSGPHRSRASGEGAS